MQDDLLMGYKEKEAKRKGLTPGQKTATKVFGVLTCLIWVGWIVARSTVGGMCERPDLVQDFDSSRYLGRWHEMYRENSVPFESEDCATATYVELPRNYIEVNNVEYAIAEGKFPRGSDTFPGKAQCSNFRSGLCQVKFFELSPWSDYSILSTDYDSHAVVYACDTFAAGAVKVDWLWVLTRTPLAIGSAAHSAMETTVFDVITS